MAGRINIRTPTNVKLLTNVVTVRMKRAGKRFEIACYRNKVLSWRQKVEKDIEEVLQTHTVFTNVSKGQVAKNADLKAAFETEDHDAILEKGELQVSDKERAATQSSTVKEVATIISDMCIDPSTKLPYPVTVIENGLKDIHFGVKPNRSSKQMALEAIGKLKEIMEIERTKMRVEVMLPASAVRHAKDALLALIATVEQESFISGDLHVTGLIEPGSLRAIDELIKKETKGKGKMELLELRHEEEVSVEGLKI